MKKVIIIMLLLGLPVFAIGCTCKKPESQSETSSQVDRNTDQMPNTEMEQKLRSEQDAEIERKLRSEQEMLMLQFLFLAS